VLECLRTRLVPEPRQLPPVLTRRLLPLAACAEDTVLDRKAPVLKYGTRFLSNRFRCTSYSNGLTCKNGAGHGRFLSRTKYQLF
jgi:hypothetical protein